MAPRRQIPVRTLPSLQWTEAVPPLLHLLHLSSQLVVVVVVVVVAAVCFNLLTRTPNMTLSAMLAARNEPPSSCLSGFHPIAIKAMTIITPIDKYITKYNLYFLKLVLTIVWSVLVDLLFVFFPLCMGR